MQQIENSLPFQKQMDFADFIWHSIKLKVNMVVLEDVWSEEN